ncbi:MAG: quinate 5-dehydrogenase [Clostridia bacterium]|nr:quinate 5-dehydrogenase [Clostridia bacterium]
MKHVVSVSLGSSRRDHSVQVTVLGERIRVERRGTDGDRRRAIRLIRELDGRVDAIGLGGIDLYIVAGGRRYVVRDAVAMARAAVRTPVVDGSGLKDTLERRVVATLGREGLIRSGDVALLVSAVDRFGMAEALAQLGCRLLIGDLAFTVGIPVMLRDLRQLDLLARVLAPLLCRLPFQLLYPTGREQERAPRGSKYAHYYQEAHIIAGDFHLIRRHFPDRCPGALILTNTVTTDDVAFLRNRGVATLVTTTPELEGRSFGTNVMEAMLLALVGRRPEEMSAADYEALLDRIGFRPRVERLNG